MTITELDVEDRVAEWFQGAWDPALPLLEWRDRLVDSGWAVPSWSSEWFGQDLPAWTERVAHQTIRGLGGVAMPLGVGYGLAAPTIYDHASDELKGRYLKPTLTGALTWCQLFSEPGAGSDLAGLQATAVLDGDEWIVNGQKVWNTSADHADMAILVARSDWDAPKHGGITYFLLDMHQPGVEARPIRQMNNHASFNEVFLTDARIPADNVVGQIGGGWSVARGTLAHERSYATNRSVQFAQAAVGRVIDEAKAEAAEYNKTYVWYPQRQGRLDVAVERATEAGTDGNPLVRQQLARALSAHRASEWTAGRAKAARDLGRPPGSEGSIGKLALSEVARQSHRVHTSMSGASAMLAGTDDETHRTIAEVLISTPAQSIAGGTDEIQRNILGEHVLGLPKEPAPDRGKPFREVGR